MLAVLAGCEIGEWTVLARSGDSVRAGCGSLLSIAILLLMLSPHLRAAHLVLVVHRARAVRPLHALLLVV